MRCTHTRTATDTHAERIHQYSCTYMYSQLHIYMRPSIRSLVRPASAMFVQQFVFVYLLAFVFASSFISLCLLLRAALVVVIPLCSASLVSVN